MVTNTFISPDELIADITPRCNDTEMRWRAKGFYVEFIKQALSELAYDTFFDEQDLDFIIPENCRIPLEAFTFNVARVIAYDGSRREKVHYKRNFITDGVTNFADIMDDTPDPLQSDTTGRESNALFYNVRNGLLILSPSCKKYKHVKVYCHGEFGNAEAKPFVPKFCAQGIKDWVVAKICQTRLSEDPKLYSFLKNDAETSRDGRINPPYDGSWYQAQYRLSTMDSGARSDLKEYLASIKYK